MALRTRRRTSGRTCFASTRSATSRTTRGTQTCSSRSPRGGTTKTRAERWKDRVTAFATSSKQAIEKTPHLAVSLVEAVKEAPKVAERVKEDITILRELRALKKKAPKHEATLDAAAEE